jgi:hypothetical protein
MPHLLHIDSSVLGEQSVKPLAEASLANALNAIDQLWSAAA